MTTPAARYKASLQRRYRCIWCSRRVVQASPFGPLALYCPKPRTCKEQAASLRRREKRQAAKGKEVAS